MSKGSGNGGLHRMCCINLDVIMLLGWVSIFDGMGHQRRPQATLPMHFVILVFRTQGVQGLCPMISIVYPEIWSLWFVHGSHIEGGMKKKRREKRRRRPELLGPRFRKPNWIGNQKYAQHDDEMSFLQKKK
jgi:hypothetical protein